MVDYSPAKRRRLYESRETWDLEVAQRDSALGPGEAPLEKAPLEVAQRDSAPGPEEAPLPLAALASGGRRAQTCILARKGMRVKLPSGLVLETALQEMHLQVACLGWWALNATRHHDHG